MRVYISGKIGEEVLSEATRQKFARAEELLQARGFETFNPTTSGLGVQAAENAERHGTTFYKEILLIDIHQLLYCDAIYMLPDFLDSKGAKAEHAFAIAIGLQVYFADELYYDWLRLHGKGYDKNRLPEVAP